MAGYVHDVSQDNESIRRKRSDKIVTMVISKYLGNDSLMKRKQNMPHVSDVASDECLKEVYTISIKS